MRRVEVAPDREGHHVHLPPHPTQVVFAARPFKEDTNDYRKAQATEMFNRGAKTGSNMKIVRSDFDTAVPHVLTSIVTRQMVEKGDPNRRSVEHSEAIGVDIKFDLHNRCVLFYMSST